MTAAELIAQLRAEGAILAVTEKRRVRILALGELPEELMREVTRLEGAIVELVSPRPRQPERPRGGSSWPAAIGEHQRETGALTSCVLCQSASWSHYAGAALCETCARDGDARVRLEYFFAVNRWFRLTVEGADAAIALEAHQQVVALADSVGEPIGSSLRRRWEREWRQKHGICPRCGTPHEEEET